MTLSKFINVCFDVTDRLLITIFCNRQLMQKKREYAGNAYQLFTEVKKAYDSVRMEVLFKIFIEFGIPMKIAGLIETCLN